MSLILANSRSYSRLKTFSLWPSEFQLLSVQLYVPSTCISSVWTILIDMALFFSLSRLCGLRQEGRGLHWDWLSQRQQSWLQLKPVWQLQHKTRWRTWSQMHLPAYVILIDRILWNTPRSHHTKPLFRKHYYQKCKLTIKPLIYIFL